MMECLNILVVDDEEAMRESLAAWLRKEGHQLTLAANGEEALKALEETPTDLMLLDMKMPGMDGLTVLGKSREKHPDLPVVMITAYGSIESAVTAMKQGARDYLLKPFDPEQLLVIVSKVLEHRALVQENLELREHIQELSRQGVDDLVADSEAMRRVIALIHNVAPTDSAVLITGETGTGKELAARAIHALGEQSYGPFVVINCGAQSESLLESALFGHERGAFSGAVATQRGRLEMADGGTLLLDEVGEISPKMQIDLLRVLEEKKFTRVGGTQPIESNFRLVCATHRDLPKRIKEGAFRADFYYRINVISIELPPLRVRDGDVDLLADYFIEQFAGKLGKPLGGLTPKARSLLNGYGWPGNVRELKNVLERAVVICHGDRIRQRDLTFGGAADAPAAGPMTLRDNEIRHLRRTLDDHDWNITRSAGVLDIDRVTLSRKLKRYGLKKER